MFPSLGFQIYMLYGFRVSHMRAVYYRHLILLDWVIHKIFSKEYK
jgi:hypothetical protein